MNKKDIHNLIDANQNHSDFGRLLYHRDRKNKKVLHYSVQLNDTESLAWEPVHSDRQKDQGEIDIWKINKHFHPAKYVHHWSRNKIIQALHISVDEFHKNWQYELFRFNCEHWARLVTTGDCRCFQIHEFKKLQKIPVAGLAIVGVAGFVTGAWEHNGYPQKAITKGL